MTPSDLWTRFRAFVAPFHDVNMWTFCKPPV